MVLKWVSKVSRWLLLRLEHSRMSPDLNGSLGTVGRGTTVSLMVRKESYWKSQTINMGPCGPPKRLVLTSLFSSFNVYYAYLLYKLKWSPILLSLWTSAVTLTVVNNILHKKKTVVGNVKWYSTLENSLAVPKKLSRHLSYNPRQLQSWAFIPERWKRMFTKTCKCLFTAALSVRALNQKQPKCPTIGQWLNCGTSTLQNTIQQLKGDNLDRSQRHYAKWENSLVLIPFI